VAGDRIRLAEFGTGSSAIVGLAAGQREITDLIVSGHIVVE